MTAKTPTSTDLQRRLEALPPALSIRIGHVVAARAALRLLPPALAFASGPSRGEIPLVPFVRCHIATAAWVSAPQQVPLSHVHAAFAALQAARALNAKRSKRRAPGSAKAAVAIGAAQSAALTLTVDRQPYAAMSAGNQMIHASDRALKEADLAASIIADVEAGEAGQEPWTLPLWTGAPDPWAKQWSAAEGLFADHDGWGVMRALYEDASAGRVVDAALLQTLARRPDEDWLRPETAVLDWIASERGDP